MDLLQSGMINYGFLHKLLYICMVSKLRTFVVFFRMSSRDMITTHREAVMCVKYNKSFKHVITASENSVSIKTESTRKLSNFNFQWTKTLY